MKTREKSKTICKNIKWIVCFVLALLLMLVPKQKAFAGNQEIVLKVGYFTQCGFIEKVNGKMTGYAVEYLEEIAKHTGWRYEFIEMPLKDCLNKVETGEIDIVCGIQKTEEREKKYIYTQMPVGYEYTAIYANKEQDICYEEYDKLNGCVIGLLGGSFHTESFINLALINDVNYRTIYYFTEDEMLEDMNNGTIDAVCMGSLHVHSGVKMVGRYNLCPFYFVTGRANELIMSMMNSALQLIRTETPRFEAELTEKYFGNNKISDRPLFTREEINYIESSDTVHIKLMQGSIPLSYTENGESRGVFVRYLELLEKYSGLDIEISMEVEPLSMEEQLKHLADGGYLLLHSELAAAESLAGSGLVATSPLLETELAYVVRKTDMDKYGSKDWNYTLAVTKEMTFIQKYVDAIGANCKVVYYDTTEECLDAVLHENADVAIQDAYVASYALQAPKYSEKLTECPGDELTNAMCLILGRENEMLLQVLNKTIHFISDSEVEQMITDEIVLNPYKLSAEDFLYQNRKIIWTVCVAFVVAVVSYLIIQKNITNLKIRRKEYEIMQKRVQQDELTGVYNRQSFYERAGEMIRKSEEDMCIVVMDVSKFKVVNDLYGMRIGDKLLKVLAKELVQLGAGRNMIVARFTGDHFYMCMRKSDFYQITFPRKFKTFLEEMEIKVNYGVFLVGGKKDIPVNIMCDRADIAAHNSDRGTLEYIHFYSEDERKLLIQEQEIENEMERAMEEGQFCAYIQPKYDVSNEEIVGGEALVRWMHPQKGMIPPDEFIRVFEKNGFIVKLDYFIWEETCKLLSDLKKQGFSTYPISVNVSRAHFYGKEISAKLMELITKYELSPKDLELEITETICAADMDMINDKISSLQSLGFKVAMDDFGSGYSSLNMLKEMPIDIIKMDMKFLQASQNEEKSRKILKTLITLSLNLEYRVVIEGVETKEQNDFLNGIGKCYAQGYYFSKPVDCESYRKMVVEGLQKRD